jgi:DNA-binding response OmpR family regulator
MRRVLFVDGEPNIRRLCSEELQDEGYVVQVAGTGSEAARLIDSFRPEVVILELWLPDMSGLEASRMVKGTDRRTRIILHTTGPPPTEVARWGVDAFVEKSFDLSQLIKTLDTVSEFGEAALPVRQRPADSGRKPRLVS